MQDSFIRMIRMERVLVHNTVRKVGEKVLMSMAELARRAGISPLTIARAERGKSGPMENKRKIILALDMNFLTGKESFWKIRYQNVAAERLI